MKKTRFSSSPIVKILKDFEGGKPIGEVSRLYGVSQGTWYNWRKNYGGMEATDLKKLTALEEENHKLNRLILLYYGGVMSLLVLFQLPQ